MFKVGDKVRVIKYCCGARVGDTGIVRWIGFETAAVEWDRKIEGHCCNGHVPSNNGLWMNIADLRFVAQDLFTASVMAYIDRELNV